ncbi:MAG: N-acetyltransferase family protein [Polyangia bacterium]
MLEVGPDFSEEHVLHDGSVVRLRHIRPEDAAELRRGFQELSPESRYRRFLGSIDQLPDAAIQYLTHVDGQDHVAIVATRPRADGSEEGIGVARYVRVHDAPTVAEAAITVADKEQHKGIGRLLGLTLARAARERGIGHFRGEILADNDAVRQLLSELGAVLHTVENGCIVFDVSLAGSPPAADGKPDAITSSILRAASTWLTGLFGSLAAFGAPRADSRDRRGD